MNAMSILISSRPRRVAARDRTSPWASTLVRVGAAPNRTSDSPSDPRPDPKYRSYQDRARPRCSGRRHHITRSVHALLSIDPNPLYVVEEPDGTSFNAREPELKYIDRSDRPRATLPLVREDQSPDSENQKKLMIKRERFS